MSSSTKRFIGKSKHFQFLLFVASFVLCNWFMARINNVCVVTFVCICYYSLLSLYVLICFCAGVSGFISIDCEWNSSYILELITGLYYVPDFGFINTGAIRSIPSTTFEKQVWNVRRYPRGTMNYYNII